ncbi:cytochrome ubiquinol oxidase subunit II [Erythrobacter litoralis]|uniref:cytochrome c oxidase subunit II n=1 Tax=Erythrobacter litoralis TaxID=39960 RepID=UPI002435A8C8|nr:cytochrome ubiquinol oxidase subunit II [Erythrobacter litoralis]MDG6078063.1 cytochrome ubiquinol oxidase subunit II [Erythrobacter litoralis]
MKALKMVEAKWIARCFLFASIAGSASGLCAAEPMRESFLQPMGPVADEQFNHLLRVIGITMVVILPVLVGVPLILWRYRYSAPLGEYTPRWEFSKKLEWVLWGVPVLVVVVLASWLWYSTQKLDPYEPLGPEPLQVQAIGLDWKWVFIYPDEGIATVNELALPVGRPVELTLTTDTVMQSLLISSLTGQIYAMPGMTTKLNFAATRPGVAEGENTQFNGTSFGRQKFTVRAMTPTDYATWTAGGGGGLLLDEATYTILRRQTVLAEARQDLGLEGTAQPIRMRATEDGILERIVAKYHTSGRRAHGWGGTGRPSDNSVQTAE